MGILYLGANRIVLGGNTISLGGPGGVIVDAAASASAFSTVSATAKDILSASASLAANALTTGRAGLLFDGQASLSALSAAQVAARIKWQVEQGQAEAWGNSALWLLFNGYWNDDREWNDLEPWRDGPPWAVQGNQAEIWT